MHAGGLCEYVMSTFLVRESASVASPVGVVLGPGATHIIGVSFAITGRTGALLSFDAMYVNSYVIWHSAVLEHTEHNFFIDLPGTVKHEV